MATRAGTRPVELANVRLPVVELPGGDRLFAPSVREVAERYPTEAPRTRLTIYGAGPAGLSAAAYAASEGLRAVLIERHAVVGHGIPERNLWCGIARTGAAASGSASKS
jgi:NADPH-dependent 2,4-dienoyl-CoA reductase/sulfur reductase-like enzyme